MGRRHRRRRHKHRGVKMVQKIGFKIKKKPSFVSLLCTGCLLRNMGHNDVTCSHYKS